MRFSTTCILSPYEQEKLIDKLNIFKIQGQDKYGNKLVTITGNLFLARQVNVEALKKYMKETVFVSISDDEEKVKPFSVVYMHACVEWRQNFHGIMVARSIYDSIPMNIKNSLQAIYFVHPDLQSRLFLATFGRLLVTHDLYSKVKYMSRLQFLWKHVKRSEMEIPEFISKHDKELDSCGQRRLAFSDYFLEIHSPRTQVYGLTSYLESPVSTFSMRHSEMAS
ncbi:uncharacterized protein LOC141698072 isoform X2 [Apium graveolens]|uniref:uncharacterized protein LOC141698072 isoform X2 n=1 Tax=Apium graveolens TaxID=4045 RepID=UPI003D7961BE